MDVSEVEEIKKNIDHCVSTCEIYKLRHYIRELRFAVGDEEATMILNANACSSVY